MTVGGLATRLPVWSHKKQRGSIPPSRSKIVVDLENDLVYKVVINEGYTDMNYIQQLTQNLTAAQLQDLMFYMWTNNTTSHKIPATIKAWLKANNLSNPVK